MSSLFAKNAFIMIRSNFEKIFENPADITARGELLLGSAYAGIAIENSMLGAAHSAANPLTSQLGIPHGKAVGITLPWIVRYNSRISDCKKVYCELAEAAGIKKPSDSFEDGIEKLIEYLNNVLKMAGYTRIKNNYPIKRDAIRALAKTHQSNGQLILTQIPFTKKNSESFTLMYYLDASKKILE